MNRILKSVIFVMAVAYIGVDAVFLAVAKPVAEWVGKWRVLDGMGTWIVSLRPYPTLALFMVPVIIFEPLKLVAAYLVATGHVRVALTTFAIGEVLKLVILERLFAVSRDKLILIPAFGWGYQKFCQIRNWLEATGTWRAARHWSKVAQDAIRSYAMHLRVSPIAIQLRRKATCNKRKQPAIAALSVPIGGLIAAAATSYAATSYVANDRMAKNDLHA